ncbi:eukaryotic translation initiation factor 3 subunit F [[Candida] anglica]|uniref:Eukaryotic translation initiation factor 3 subunit F n=1 Tax=[Candida] anglica TaxID=148631 RepID=A0ABP0EAT9_9ASCO
MSSQTSFMHLVRPAVSAPAASSTASPCNVKIHTSALFQILEILSQQALDSNKRVIGTLLGLRSDDGSEFEVRDAFMVTCTETGDAIAIEEETHKKMYQLYKKAHPKESVLGWFGSSSELDSTTGLIHDFYSKGSDRAFPYPAIYLNVDFLAAAKTSALPTITTFIGAAVGKPGQQAARIGWKAVSTTNSYVFTPIPNEVVTKSVTEKLALNTLREAQAQRETVVTVAGNDRHLSHLSAQLQSVTATIDALLQYIQTKPNSDRDIDLLRLLSNTLLNRPQSLSNLDELEKKFRAHNTDVIMIEFLTKAVKEQIELSARLTAEADKK